MRIIRSYRNHRAHRFGHSIAIVPPIMIQRLLIGGWALSIALLAQSPPASCNAGAASPSLTIALPARPFAVTTTQDGCWILVSGVGGALKSAGIAVLKRENGRVELARMVPLKSRAALGVVLTHDEKLLVVAAGDAVLFLDVQRMISGKDDPLLGSFSDGSGAGSIYPNITPDDQLLFVSDERRRSITVIDLVRARGNGYQADAIIGHIPAGNLPIALAFSPDGKWMYATSEVALPDWKWPKACKSERDNSAGAKVKDPEGAVLVVDVARAKTDPAQAVVGRIPAGCRPVRLAISPDGARLYATARGGNAVLGFDTGKLVSDPAHARLGMAPVGAA